VPSVGELTLVVGPPPAGAPYEHGDPSVLE